MKINIFRSLFISTALFAFFFLSCKKEKEVIPPEILTYRISNLTYTTAEISGEVINNGGAEVIARGFCYAPLENPTFSDYTTSNGAGNGVFSSKLTGLNPGTKYYLRAYAINSVGIGYGNQINFTTVPLTLAMLTTETPTFITSNSAISGGNILNDGGSFIKERVRSK
jgi:hypothetical protein